MGAYPSNSRRPRKGRRAVAAGGAAALILTAAACGSSSSGGNNASPGGGGTKQQGGTATFALPPGVVPTYIFPFSGTSYFQIQNTDYFQYLMYRPLYWFGNGADPTLNPQLSLADQPTFNGDKVTIKLKDYKWSNGEQVTAKDVLFWIHMLQAEGPTNWGAFVPGPNGFPANVSNVKADSDTELSMTMAKAYNPTWFTYNALSQITPMPKAWDRTANGPSDCTDNESDCAAVFSYLDGQSKDKAGYAGSHIWGVVDGPWKLSSFNSDGHASFVPNTSYSGPVKPTLTQFNLLPFTTESSEYNVLRSGSNQITVGYLPSTDAPTKPANQKVGSNPVGGYTLDPLYVWSINYFPVNNLSTTGNGPINKQLYFRQAMQYLVNQESVISGPLHGYGYATPGPVPLYPDTPFASDQTKKGDPFPYDPAKAKELLTSHGWNVVPNGTTTCSDPAKCGEGVHQGQALKFNLPYATGTGWIESMVQQLKSNTSQVGIQLNLEPKLFPEVAGPYGGNCVISKQPCDWDMAIWGGGWQFSPDYYPTGETLFQSNATSNASGYTDTENDNLINQTLTASNDDALHQWQDYVGPKLPENWLPNGVYSLTEVQNTLQGAIPQSTTGSINPEAWYFTK